MELLHLSVENFRSIKKADLDLSNKNLIGVIGEYINNQKKSNGAGKSSIVESILFALYKFNPRTVRKTNDVDSFIKDLEDYTEVSLTFKTKENKYKIVRRLNRKNTETVILYINDEKQDLKKTEIKKEIENITGIKRPQLFTYINFFTENVESLFNKTPSERINILIKDFLNMDIFKKYRDKVYKLKTENKKTIENLEYEQHYREEDLNLFKNQLDEFLSLNITNKIKELRNVIADANNKKKDIELSLKEYSLIKEKNNQVTLLLSQKKTNEERLSFLEKNINDYKKQFSELNEQIINIQNALTNENNTEKNDAFYNDLKDKIKTIQEKKESVKKQIISLETQQNILNNRLINMNKIDGVCYVCGTKLSEEHKQKEIDNINKDITQIKTQIISLNEMLENINKSEQNISEKINNIENYRQKENMLKQQYEGLLKNKEIIQTNLENYTKEYTSVLNTSKELSNKLDKLLSEIPDTEINIDDLESNKQKLETFIINTQNDINELNNVLKKIDDLKEKIANYKKSLTEIKRKIEENKKTQIYLDILYMAFGSSGIPVLLLKELLLFVEEHSNNILKEITTDKKIEFVFEKQNDDTDKTEVNMSLDFNIINQITNTQKSFADLSTGEKVIMSFALRMGFSYFLSLQAKPINFVVLDDILAVLDEYNSEQIIKILYLLRNRFKQTIILSHSNIKDIFPHIIKVIKQEDDSAIASLEKNNNTYKINEFLKIIDKEVYYGTKKSK